jgi:hypothetical protein
MAAKTAKSFVPTVKRGDLMMASGGDGESPQGNTEEKYGVSIR